MAQRVCVGVLAIQGSFYEHLKVLRIAAKAVISGRDINCTFLEVRTSEELAECDALIIPGGESTTMSLVAAQSGLLEPLRHFVKVLRKPTWGTCAGLILLAESANRTKKGGQDLLGGLNVRVNRNYFGRQTESFQSKLDLPFLCEIEPSHPIEPFDGIFIRAPVVEKILSPTAGEQMGKPYQKDTVTAPARVPNDTQGSVEIMAVLPGRGRALKEKLALTEVEEGSSVVSLEEEMGNIIAVRQQNVFGTSFHPELTEDSRVHKWWLEQVIAIVADRSNT